MINGASGGVGTFAVQIAKSYGREVTGVTSTQNIDLVRSLGADRVVDYTRTDFVGDGQRYDLIVDTIGNRSVRDLRRALAEGGKAAVVGFTSVPKLMGFPCSAARSSPWCRHAAAKDLERLSELIQAGKVRPQIDRRYPFAEIPAAIAYLEHGHARGGGRRGVTLSRCGIIADSGEFEHRMPVCLGNEGGDRSVDRRSEVRSRGAGDPRGRRWRTGPASSADTCRTVYVLRTAAAQLNPPRRLGRYAPMTPRRSATSHRRSPSVMGITGVFRSWPVLRPRVISDQAGPIPSRARPRNTASLSRSIRRIRKVGSGGPASDGEAIWVLLG